MPLRVRFSDMLGLTGFAIGYSMLIDRTQREFAG